MIKKNDMLTAIATKCEESGLKITKKDLDTVLKAQSDFLLETIAANEEVKIGDVMKSLKSWLILQSLSMV